MEVIITTTIIVSIWISISSISNNIINSFNQENINSIIIPPIIIISNKKIL